MTEDNNRNVITIEPVRVISNSENKQLVNNNVSIQKTSLTKKQKRKLTFLVFMMLITLLLLIGGTYAWFIGLGAVKVNEFDLNVTAGNQLELSLTGNTNDWHDDITISEDNVITAGYTGNTNHGVGTEGLKPISTVGHIDSSTYRLDLFSKTSLTSTKGGYRVLTDKVDNSAISGEQDGYFVFDLFIRNGKDLDYIETFNYDDDEDIYLVKNPTTSAVGAPAGGGDDYGIANSIRVAFMQIGRIKSNGYTPSVAQQITCSNDSTRGITGLCNQGVSVGDTGLGKTWNIWEPNDNKHHEQAVERFNFICKTRELSGGALNYTSNSCTPLTTTSIVSTYPVNRQITASMDAVDIYDGLNGYTSFDDDYGISYIDTLTDSEVNVTDNSIRQSVFRLAPNSITKIRVYIYLEGQDVDNYDLIYKGEKIKIKFGFTRDRYEMEEDNPAPQEPVSFSTDSWETIKSAATQGTAQTTYHVGDTKTINMGTLGTHTIRIANMSTPSECSRSDFSQTACGFVVEFADIISKHNMNPSGTYKGVQYDYGWNVDGWPASSMRTYVNNDIYNALPSDLQSAIISTKVISGHGSTSGETNFISTDKLYLLSPHEVWIDGSYFPVSEYDTAYNNTRQLDYYAGLGVTTSSSSGAIKQYNGSNVYWWLRSTNSSSTRNFFGVSDNGGYNIIGAYNSDGVSPAFRLK